MSSTDRSALDPPYARIMPVMAFLANPILQTLRARAVQRLGLQPGDSVIDAGCGMGSNFPFLCAAVGPAGRVVGVDISPYLAAKARQFVLKRKWPNVEVIVAAAHAVELADQYDGLLLFAVHEVLTSPAALDNLLSHVKEGAGVVTFGSKQTQTFPGALLNPVWRRASRTWLAGAAPMDAQPWRALAQRIQVQRVEEYLFGAFYLVSGVVASSSPIPSAG